MDEYHDFIAGIKAIQLPDKVLLNNGITEPVNFKDFQNKFRDYQRIIANACEIRRVSEIG